MVGRPGDDRACYGNATDEEEAHGDGKVRGQSDSDSERSAVNDDEETMSWSLWLWTKEYEEFTVGGRKKEFTV
jgi:hypothetical protein